MTLLQAGAVVHDYWLTDGIYGSLNCIQRDGASVAPEPLRSPLLPPVSPAEEERLYPTTLFRPTCDGMDTIVRDDTCALPVLRLGDWVIFKRMGVFPLKLRACLPLLTDKHRASISHPSVMCTVRSC